MALSFARVALLLALGGAGCRRSTVAAPVPAEAPRSEVLPARIGVFVGGPLVVDANATRRTYTQGSTRIDVTLARYPMNAAAYDSWVAASVAGFPQAALGVPAEDANGFYQCTTGARPTCDLLVQLRAGVHLEIRGAGTSTRADVDAIARGLDLGALARGSFGPATTRGAGFNRPP